MKFPTWLNPVCITIAALCAIASGYFLFVHSYGLSLIFILGTVCCMELRVRAGYRGPRKIVFPMHIAFSTGYLVGLIACLSLPYALWPLPLAWLSYIGMVCTGIVLIRQSKKPVY